MVASVLDGPVPRCDQCTSEIGHLNGNMTLFEGNLRIANQP